MSHGLDRRVNSQSAAIAQIGDILHNSIVVNEVEPKKDGVRNSWIMLGAAEDGDGNIILVRSVINQSTMEIDEVSALYAALQKNRTSRAYAPDASPKGFSNLTDSKISIADLRASVNGIFDDVISADVAEKLGIERSKSKFSDRLLYQSRNQTDTPEFERWFKESKIVNEDGSPKLMYHGTPYGGFTVFKDWQHFTDKRECADVYQNPSASSIRGRYDDIMMLRL